jgi:hypothetical protein
VCALSLCTYAVVIWKADRRALALSLCSKKARRKAKGGLILREQVTEGVDERRKKSFATWELVGDWLEWQVFTLPQTSNRKELSHLSSPVVGRPRSPAFHSTTHTPLRINLHLVVDTPRRNSSSPAVSPPQHIKMAALATQFATQAAAASTAVRRSTARRSVVTRAAGFEMPDQYKTVRTPHARTSPPAHTARLPFLRRRPLSLVDALRFWGW